MTRLKVCGLRDADSALVAADEGADFLGFIFVPGTRRQLSVEEAGYLIGEYRRRRGSGGPRLVGVFADQPTDDINRIVDLCGLDLTQLCGDEDPEHWRSINVPIIKQVKVRDDWPREKAVADATRRASYVLSKGHMVILDRYEAGAHGGTGRSFDWGIARYVSRCHDFLMAGGLTPGNVGRAIEEASPWGVDVSSGVETDGVKDPMKVRQFAEAVRQADAVCAGS